MAGVGPAQPAAVDPAQAIDARERELRQDPFVATMWGQYPQSTNSGSAKTWFPGPDNVARPDRSYDTLMLLSFFGFGSMFGLTDFYLRSPLTGIIKIVLVIVFASGTMGVAAAPLFLAGILEFLHIWFEKPRVVTYGMSSAFDLATGIGQGMITDKETHYKQTTDFTTWQILSLLGPLGIDAFYQGIPALGFRKVFDTLIFVGFAVGAWRAVWDERGLGSIITLLMFASIFGIFVIIPWMTSLSSLRSPTSIFSSDGGSKYENLLNFFYSWIKRSFGPNTGDEVKRDFGITMESGAELKEKFEIKWVKPEGFSAIKTVKKLTHRSNESLWPLSFALGNVISGPFLIIFRPLIDLIMKWIMTGSPVGFMPPPFTTSVEASYMGIKALREGRTAGLAGGLLGSALGGRLPGGLGGMASVLGSSNPLAAAAGALGSSNPLAAAAGALGSSNPLAAAAGALGGGLPGGLSSTLEGAATQALSGRLPGGLGDAATQALSAAATNPLAAATGALGSHVPGRLGEAAAALGGGTGGLSSALEGAVANPLDVARRAALPNQGGGARTEPESALSTEAIALGATVAALIAGGAIKLAVDSLVTK